MAFDFPSSPSVGQKYPVPQVAGSPQYTWDGEKWKTGPGSSYPTIVISDSPPASAPDNALWFESDTGLLYVRFNDGSSTQWVIACPQPDLSVFAPLASPLFTGDPRAPTPALADNDTSIASTAFVKLHLLRGHLSGMTLSNDAVVNTMLNISRGVCVDSTGLMPISIAAPFKKSFTGPWIAGSGNTGMGTGLTASVTTWYHVFAIINGGVSDIYFDTSVGAANAPAGTTAFRRIGSIYYNSLSYIMVFAQMGDTFWISPQLDWGPTSAPYPLSLYQFSIPQGVICQPILQIRLVATSGGLTIRVAPAANAAVVNFATLGTDNSVATVTLTVATGPPSNTNRQIYVATFGESGSWSAQISCIGWIDTRDKDA